MKFPFWIWYLLAAAGWLGASIQFWGGQFWGGGNYLLASILLLGILLLGISGRGNRRPVAATAGLCLLILGASGINTIWQSGTNQSASVPAGKFEGPAYLISDPSPVGTGLAFRVEIQLQNQFQDQKLKATAFAYGSQKVSLRERLAGEWVWISGQLSPISPMKSGNFETQARLSVNEVGNHKKGPIHFQLANGIRRTLANGADSLGENQKPLFSGIVYGDDKSQSIASRELFRSTGLTHIMAVSGQNVALVLAVFYPLALKFSNSLRWLLLSGTLGIFLTITRFEPSVMRASAMAFIALVITHRSEWRRHIDSRAILGIAVLALLFITPEIALSLAFQLSVAATAGIIFLSPLLSQRLGGPAWFRLPLSITISAQLAVAPLLIFAFGGVAVASLPANILALPAVSLLMVWGMSAGLLAGILEGASGGLAGQIIHFPSRLLLSWVEGVAGWSENLGLGWLGYWHIFGILSCLVLSLFITPRAFRVLLGLAALAILFLPAALVRLESPGLKQLGSMGFYSPEHRLLVLDNELSGSELLKNLRQVRISSIELLVFLERPRGGVQEALESRYKIKRLWAPQEIYLPGAEYPVAGSDYSLGDLVLRVLSSNKRIQLQAGKLEL